MASFDASNVRAYADAYTEEELRGFLLEAMELQRKGGSITSATSAGGGSFTKTLQMSPTELIQLYQAALDLKLGRANENYSSLPVIWL